MTIAELKIFLDELVQRPGFGPDTDVFIDDAIGGLQEPAFTTTESHEDGTHIVIIETPKDTINEVT